MGELASPFLDREAAAESAQAPELAERAAIYDKFPSDEETGVFESDTRVRITNTLAVPFRWICHIAIEDERGRLLNGGTGVLISDHHLLTAAHLVYDKHQNPHQYSVYVTPARNYGDEPFGRYLVSAKPKVPRHYDHNATGDARFEFDYALLALPEAIGRKTFSRLKGPLCYWGSDTCGDGTQFRRLAPALLAAKKALTAGYPGRHGGGKLYCAVGLLHSIALRGHLRTMRIQADATPGQSGSPVWLKVNGNPCLVGIMVGAGKYTNTVVRLTREMATQVTSWIASDAEVATGKEVGSGSRLEAQVDEVYEKPSGGNDASDVEASLEQVYEISWEGGAEDQSEYSEATEISEECEEEFEADEEAAHATVEGQPELEREGPQGVQNYQKYFGQPRAHVRNEFDRLTLNQLFGRIYGRSNAPHIRGRLTFRDRALVNVALLAALGRDPELKAHLKAAEHQGFSRDQLTEIMIHVAHYAGWPAGHNGMSIVERFFDEKGERSGSDS